MYHAKKYQVFFIGIDQDGDEKLPFKSIILKPKSFTVELTFEIDGSLPLEKIKAEAEENLNVFSNQLIVKRSQLKNQSISNVLHEIGSWLEVESSVSNTSVVLEMVKNQFDHSDILSRYVIKIKVWNGSKSEYSKIK